MLKFVRLKLMKVFFQNLYKYVYTSIDTRPSISHLVIIATQRLKVRLFNRIMSNFESMPGSSAIMFCCFCYIVLVLNVYCSLLMYVLFNVQNRVMSNLESMPGGSAALQRAFTDIQSPMMDSLARNPFASLASNSNEPSGQYKLFFTSI